MKAFSIIKCSNEDYSKYEFRAVPSQDERAPVSGFTYVDLLARYVSVDAHYAMKSFNLDGVDRLVKRETGYIINRDDMGRIIVIDPDEPQIVLELSSEFPPPHILGAIRIYDQGIAEGQRQKATEVRKALDI